jgi:sialidase-1
VRFRTDRRPVAGTLLSASDTTLYADGAPIASITGAGLFGQLSGLDGMWVSRNVDDGGPQRLYAGHVDRVAVYGAP